MALWAGVFAGWLVWVLCKYLVLKDTDAHFVLQILFCNQQEAVEGLLRRLGGCGVSLVLVDTGSYDDTPAILQRLAQTYNWQFCPNGSNDGQLYTYDARGLHNKELINAAVLSAKNK